MKKVRVSILFKHQPTPLHALINGTEAIRWQGNAGERWKIPYKFWSYQDVTDKEPSVTFVVDPSEILAIQFVEA